MTTEPQKPKATENREKAILIDPSDANKRAEYLTAKQLAEILQISESTIHKLRRAGKIPAVMLTERLIRFHLKDVKHALRSIAQPGGNHHDPAAQNAEPDPQLSFADLFEDRL
jgi:excisionase family DNA binding protein